MKHWERLGSAIIPRTSDSLNLYKGKDDYFILLNDRHELMSTRKHGSEDELGRLPCSQIAQVDDARVLIGGLGMGFTLAAALIEVSSNAVVTVAELVPEVVEWNRSPLGAASGYPLNDPRTRVYPGDVAELLRGGGEDYDVIALDVDNGPEGLTARGNDWLYAMDGIMAAINSLRPGGIVAYWSAIRDRKFRKRLSHCGLKVDEVSVFAHGTKGTRHTIWLASEKGL